MYHFRKEVSTYNNLAVFEAFGKCAQYSGLMLFLYDTRGCRKYPKSNFSLTWVLRLTRDKEHLEELRPILAYQQRSIRYILYLSLQLYGLGFTYHYLNIALRSRPQRHQFYV